MWFQRGRGWTHHSLVFWRHHNEEEKLKFYRKFTSCSFCLCNPACSLQSLDHIGLRKWGLTILGTGAYLTHPCPALCNRSSPCKPAKSCLSVCKKLCNPFVRGSELGVLTLPEAHQRNKPEFSNSLSMVLGFSSTGFCNNSSHFYWQSCTITFRNQPKQNIKNKKKRKTCPTSQ